MKCYYCSSEEWGRVCCSGVYHEVENPEAWKAITNKFKKYELTDE